MPMKQINTFELNEQLENYVEQPAHNDLPCRRIINHILNYSKALEVIKTRSGGVLFNVIN